MKLRYLTAGLIWFVSMALNARPPHNGTDIQSLMEQMYAEIRITHEQFEALRKPLVLELQRIRKELYRTSDKNRQIDLLIRKDIIRHRLRQLELTEQTQIFKIRYLKGLSVIRILYEKVLDLDHHFASIVTFREINKMANPNHYPEFLKVKEIIERKKDRKKSFELPSLLSQNLYVSTITTLINLFNASVSPKDKERDLEKIQCILDFTLRMHTDLNTIYFEMEFLKKSNDKVLEDLQRLFKDYTKPIGYFVSLKECRMNDDWDTVQEKLNKYLEKLQEAMEKEDNHRVMQMQINLNFPIDQLLQFINEYNIHIDQSAKFYEKFKIILNSYENEPVCSASLPEAYKKLKSDIDITIEKFNTAYKPVEVNGSKLKEILYGINEYQ